MKYLIPCIVLMSILTVGTTQATDTATIDFDGTISQPTSCSLTTSDIELNIGDVDKAVFTSIGTPSRWSPNVALVSGGCNATKVSMTFTGVANTSNRNLFAVAADGGREAKGVGIQLEKTGGGAQAIPNDTTKPVTFDPQPSGQGYSFAARYVQTDATVTTGTANATITVLITYI